MSVLSHYHRQHPEENTSCNRIGKYSHQMNMQTEMDLSLPIHTLFLFDSESTDPVVPCFGESNELNFCEYCSYSGNWVSLFEHFQKTHASIKIVKTGEQKESERKIVNNVQGRAPLGPTSTFNSEPQVVFQCQVCNFTCSSRRVICRHYCIRQSVTCAQIEDSDIVFKCALCTFTHLTQKGLINHYLVYHDIEPQYSSRGMKTGHNELFSLVSNDDDLKAGMEKQICILCSFKAITQKELLFHYKLRHPQFYSQNRCTIECRNNGNLHVTNLDTQFYEIKKTRESEGESVNAVLEWGMSTKSVINTKEPLTFNDGDELELISCKGNQSLITAMPAKLRNQNNSPNYEGKINNSFTTAINSINVTRLPTKQFSLSTSGRRYLEYNLIMPEKQNVDNSDLFCEFDDPLNTLRVQECISSAEEGWQQGDLLPGNEVSSRAQVTSVQETDSESTMKHSPALEGYRCRHCARLFKALAGLRNHEKTHCTSKTCNHPVTKSRKRKNSLKNGKQTASSETVFLEFPHSEYQEGAVQTSDSGMKAIPKPAKAQNYACEFCTFTTCQFQNVKKHYRKVHRENLYFECRKCYYFSGKKNALSQHAQVCELTAGEKNCSTRMMNNCTFEESSTMAGSENKGALFFKEDFGLTSTASESGMLHCPICLYCTKHKSRMVNHALEHKNEQMAYVEECQLELMHFPGEVFCCDWCTFVAFSQDTLIHHMDTHSPMKPYKCRLCFFEAKLQTELEIHLQEQHKVKCNYDLVGEVNLNEADLGIEIEEFQRKRFKKSRGEKKRIQRCIRLNHSTKSTRFPCEFCGRRFLDHSEWICHVQRHSIGS
ncbi:uncharacterized protein LOC144479376 [Mustelus asterias]